MVSQIRQDRRDRQAEPTPGEIERVIREQGIADAKKRQEELDANDTGAT